MKKKLQPGLNCNMHVLIFVEKLSIGGAERVASLWADGFINKGYDVSIITCTQSAVDYPLSEKVNVLNIYPFSKFKIVNKCAWVWKLRPLIKKISPTVIITLLYPWNVKVLLSSIGLGIPLINTEHGVLERPSHSKHSFFRKFNINYINRFFDLVTILTNADKSVVQGKLRNIYVLPNPLSFKPIDRLQEKKKIILASGRLDAWHYKGFDILLKSWAKIAHNFPEWRLLICGAGSKASLDYLKSIVSSYSIESQVEFSGFCNNIEKVYRESEIFVLSSRYEAFGMVLIEAMSQGCACIACDYKGRQREIITNNLQGVLCPTEDEHAVAEALQKVISDDKFRHVLQQNAIERSKFYELPNIMKCWDEIFEKIGLKKNSL